MHSFINGHLGCFLIFAVINNAAIKKFLNEETFKLSHDRHLKRIERRLEGTRDKPGKIN